MNRQQSPSSLSHQLSDDRRVLGRDDPVWPHYVKEAEKWDKDLVDRWNKSMDVTLLFAALFSAIVTAFLIESYQNLKPDHAEITATGVLAVLEHLRAASANQVLNTTNIEIPATDEFQPTTNALLVNLAWFLSLTLSIVVTLLAMLVKQWGEAYRSGSGLAPPCVQARVRQARYNKLKSWRTEDIVVSLPVLMHIALGLFLLGLILFLLDLNRVVFMPVAIVVGITFPVYLATTLLPLFVAFCPYNTPLSSRKLLEAFLNMCNLLVPHTWKKYIMASCQLKENLLCENTDPDYLTSQALEWLIRHSPKDVVDIGIKAISGADLDTNSWELLAQGSLISVVAQKFTAICGKPLDQSSEVDPNQNNRDAYLYGQALVNISSHAELKLCSHNGITGYSTSKSIGSQVEIDEGQVYQVEKGLLQ
ncbi:unnamed protein product [Rhizoctonia solani]|uniref:DUF6535 domain-containing protein n=1 Tax=Rhizoctonia solani TaxID=456999 RepID=A0A8H3CU61_9AGAM|nr:unnamed protein product [Rhizoctonia solani]CAE6517875.1 unnamed protein product [Rhizoctonia solani]